MKKLLRVVLALSLCISLLAITSCNGNKGQGSGTSNGNQSTDHTHLPGDAVIENKIDATCQYVGYYESVIYCTDCGEELSRQTTMLPNAEHTPTAPVRTAEISATCEEDGSYEMASFCSVCDTKLESVTFVIPHTGHNWVGVECSNCDATIPTSVGLAYKLSSDGSYYSVSGIGSCTDTDLVIPPTYEGLPVKAIEANAFYANDSITSVTTLSSMERIGEYAFFNCYSIGEITLSEGLVTVDKYAFFGCLYVTFLDLPDSLVTIDAYGFGGMPHLTSVSLGSGLATVGERAFYSGNILEVKNNSTLPLTVGSSDLGSVAAYALNVYSDKDGKSNLTITDDGFVMYFDSTHRMLVGYVGEGGELVLPEYEGGYEIYKNAFIYIKTVTGIKANPSVTKLGDSAFYSCESLAYFVGGEQITSFGSSAFANCISLKTVELYDRLTSLPSGLFSGCRKLTDVTIPESVTEISSDVFANCESLVNISIPKSVTYLGSSAFSGTAIKSIEIPQGIKRIPSYLFKGCLSLEKVVIPDSVTVIEYYAFELCHSLREIEIPESVTRIEKCAFAYCLTLTSITIGHSVTELGDELFASAVKLETVILPTSLTKIGKDIFNACRSLKEVYYLGTEADWSLVSVGPNNSTLLSTVAYFSETEPKSEGRFWHYVDEEITLWPTLLAKEELSFTISDDGSYYIVTGIGTYKESAVVIPSEYNGLPVKEIANYAFRDCTQMTSVTIPASIVRIGYGAAYGCTNLTKVNIADKNGWMLMVGQDATDGTEVSSMMLGLVIGNSSLWRPYVVEDDTHWVIKK